MTPEQLVHIRWYRAWQAGGIGALASRGPGGEKCRPGEAVQNLRPPKATTWAPRGKTPVVRVTGKGYGRVCLAGPVRAKPGMRTRLMYRMRYRSGLLDGFILEPS
ncbi:hypothetical protein [Streptosporangium roseum]|uniref:hypothetical protein n=1 Tax=Streptosporangium roseum TaxID=2001 RepID=UPI00332A75B6